MKKDVLIKTSTFGMVFLFIGVSVYPTFANNIKIDSDQSNIVSEKDTPTTYEVYENSNCLVIGGASNTLSDFSATIYFGYTEAQFPGWDPAHGWIYTKGSQGAWKYEGDFWGNLGEAKFYLYNEILYHYIGIKNFTGFKFGGHYPFMFYCIFFGFAKTVSITTEQPSS